MLKKIQIPDKSSWLSQAIYKIEGDFQRSADTHLIKMNFPCLNNITIYLKDESTHPTGSLKHRLARSLFLYALCNGWINSKTTIIDASSGSTAVSEAYFAQLLNLPFIAVMTRTTAQKKIQEIEFYGGKCHFVDKAIEIYDESKRLAKQLNGHYIDQFTYAERATDWLGNNNIASSIFKQMSLERYAVPSYVVMSAGTGGTSATIGRYIRYKCLNTKLCVVDPDFSVFREFYKTRDSTLTLDRSSRIEGIGRPRVEPSFIPEVIDEMRHINDGASIATIHWLKGILGRKVGPSTGTNLFGALQIATEMQGRNEKGSIVSLLCDTGERYLDTHFNTEWLENNIEDLNPWLKQLDCFYKNGYLMK